MLQTPHKVSITVRQAEPYYQRFGSLVSPFIRLRRGIIIIKKAVLS